MFKAVVLLVIIMGAFGIAIILVRRLADTAQRLADLRHDLRRNDERLKVQLDRMETLTSENQKAGE